MMLADVFCDMMRHRRRLPLANAAKVVLVW